MHTQVKTDVKGNIYKLTRWNQCSGQFWISCLALQHGNTLLSHLIFLSVNEQWLEGQCKGKVGIFPACFAEMSHQRNPLWLSLLVGTLHCWPGAPYKLCCSGDAPTQSSGHNNLSKSLRSLRLPISRAFQYIPALDMHHWYEIMSYLSINRWVVITLWLSDVLYIHQSSTTLKPTA